MTIKEFTNKLELSWRNINITVFNPTLEQTARIKEICRTKTPGEIYKDISLDTSLTVAARRL